MADGEITIDVRARLDRLSGDMRTAESHLIRADRRLSQVAERSGRNYADRFGSSMSRRLLGIGAILASAESVVDQFGIAMANDDSTRSIGRTMGEGILYGMAETLVNAPIIRSVTNAIAAQYDAILRRMFPGAEAIVERAGVSARLGALRSTLEERRSAYEGGRKVAPGRASSPSLFEAQTPFGRFVAGGGSTGGDIASLEKVLRDIERNTRTTATSGGGFR